MQVLSRCFICFSQKCENRPTKQTSMFYKTHYVTRYNPLHNITTPIRYITLTKNAVPNNERFLERYKRYVMKIT